jgi:hypothetical protein
MKNFVEFIDGEQEDMDELDGLLAEGVGLNLAAIYTLAASQINRIKDEDMRLGFRTLSRLVLVASFLENKDMKKVLHKIGPKRR